MRLQCCIELAGMMMATSDSIDIVSGLGGTQRFVANDNDTQICLDAQIDLDQWLGCWPDL